MVDGKLLEEDFRSALSRFASGVTVVTARNEEGRPFGFTASSFCSLSLDPPLVLVCLDRRADSFPVFEKAEHFGVSVLADGQADVALKFATRGADKFSGSPTEDGCVVGVPLVARSLAQLECRMYEQLDGGDHVILVGEVMRAAATDGAPLLHFNRQFGEFLPAG